MLALPSVLTASEAAACERQLRQAIRASAEAHIVIAAEALTRFDSAALAVLLSCRRETQQSAKTFGVRGMGPRLQALAQLYGVAELLPAA